MTAMTVAVDGATQSGFTSTAAPRSVCVPEQSPAVEHDVADDPHRGRRHLRPHL